MIAEKRHEPGSSMTPNVGNYLRTGIMLQQYKAQWLTIIP
jgi:hypothetical protein